jgi:hypothetical protein
VTPAAHRAAPAAAALLAGLLLFADGAAAKPPRYRGELAGLERAADRGLDELYLRPGAELGRFRSVLVEPVALAEDLETGDYHYEESDLRFVQERFRERVAEELAAGLAPAEEPGPGVLRLRLTLTEIRSNRRPLDRGPEAPRNVLSASRGVGAAAMQLELRDSVGGELLLAAADRYQGWEFSGNQNLSTTWGDAERAFRAWGRTLLRLLQAGGAADAR